MLQGAGRDKNMPTAEKIGKSIQERALEYERQSIPLLLQASRRSSRTTLVKFHNNTVYRLTKRRADLDSVRESLASICLVCDKLRTPQGYWTVEPPDFIFAGEREVPFGSESSGFLQGTQGKVVYGLQHSHYGNLSATLIWDNPFIGSNSVDAVADEPLRLHKKMSAGPNNHVVFTLYEPS